MRHSPINAVTVEVRVRLEDECKDVSVPENTGALLQRIPLGTETVSAAATISLNVFALRLLRPSSELLAPTTNSHHPFANSATSVRSCWTSTCSRRRTVDHPTLCLVKCTCITPGIVPTMANRKPTAKLAV